MGNNIFISDSTKSAFSKVIYDKLMTRDFVGYADVLDAYWGKNPGYHSSQKLSYAKGYNDLKKAFSEMLRLLRAKEEDCIEEKTVCNRVKAYRYIGASDDPLCEERRVAIKKSMQDYVDFCINASGLLPEGWFSNYFEGTQELIDAKNRHSSGTYHISYGNDFLLRNIRLLPLFNDAILNRRVLKLTYKPFIANEQEIVFHPQFLKEYNGRWFVLGEADCKPSHVMNIALDRLEGEIEELPDVEYIPADKGFYREYFADIVGVTHLDKAKLETVSIRTKSEYMHNLIGTKMLHRTMKETKPFQVYEDGEYGEFTMQVEPNYELESRLLSYGSGIEVIKPNSLRKRLSDVIERMRNHYQKKDKNCC